MSERFLPSEESTTPRAVSRALSAAAMKRGPAFSTAGLNPEPWLMAARRVYRERCSTTAVNKMNYKVPSGSRAERGRILIIATVNRGRGNANPRASSYYGSTAPRAILNHGPGTINRSPEGSSGRAAWSGGPMKGARVIEGEGQPQRCASPEGLIVAERISTRGRHHTTADTNSSGPRAIVNYGCPGAVATPRALAPRACGGGSGAEGFPSPRQRCTSGTQRNAAATRPRARRVPRAPGARACSGCPSRVLTHARAPERGEQEKERGG